MRIFLALALLLCATNAFATDANISWDKQRDIVGWHLHVVDDDIDDTPFGELMTYEDTAFAQLTAADTLEMVSTSATDTTQTATITGIRNGEVVSTTMEVNGTNWVCNGQTFDYIDSVELDAHCAGTLTFRDASGDVTVTQLNAGRVREGQAQHFNGELHSYITSWDCGVITGDGDIKFELRYYPDDASCLIAGCGGYKVLDTIYIESAATSPYNVTRNYSQAIRCPAGGWIAVYADGSTTNCDGYTTVQGFDHLR